MEATKDISIDRLAGESTSGKPRKERGNLQTNLEFLSVRILLGAMGLLPRRLALAAGGGLGWVASRSLGRLRQTALRNLELAFPEMSATERLRIARAVFRNLGRQTAEVSQLGDSTPQSLGLYVEYGPETIARLEAANSLGKGVIFLTSHLGAWELTSLAHSAITAPFCILVRPLDNPRIETMIQSFRTRFGNRLIDKSMAARTAIRLLNQGQTVGILADLNTQPHEGVFVPFFGHPACTTAGVAGLALRTGAAVVPIFSVWEESRGKYVIYTDPQIEIERTGDKNRDVVVNTARFAAVIESQIRRYPDQWMWIHKRWKTRPPGLPELY